MVDFDTVLLRFRDRLLAAIGDKPDWSRASRTLDVVAELTVDAIERGADDDVAALENLLREMYADVIVTNDINLENSAESFAHQLLGYLRLVGIANLNRRTLSNKEASDLDHDLTIRIMRELAGQQPKTSEDLAVILDEDFVAVASKLALMRNAGLIRTWLAGVKQVNQLTTRGRQIIHLDRVPDVIPAPPLPPYLKALQSRDHDLPRTERDYGLNSFKPLAFDVPSTFANSLRERNLIPPPPLKRPERLFSPAKMLSAPQPTQSGSLVDQIPVEPQRS